MIAGFLNHKKSQAVFDNAEKKSDKKSGYGKPLTTRRLLQIFLDKHNADRDVFHDLMPFKAREILLVASLYDAYSIEGEGQFTDHILGEYHQLNLTAVPRVTAVSSGEEALARLDRKHFDLTIIMVGADKKSPIELYRSIKKKYSYQPTYLLLNNNNDIPFVRNELRNLDPYDHFFVWNGDSKVFFAMVKLLEDRVNIQNDTRVGFTRIILLVEDNTKYFSRYLPVLYTTILEQTKSLIEDVGMDDRYKVLKLRARPKVLLATNYEEAVEIINDYRDYLLGIISDARFPRQGIVDSRAGYKLLKYVRTFLPNLPAIFQSYEPGNAVLAEELNANFIDKNSESLFQDLRHFINYYLGFGHFVYRDQEGREIAVARSMEEFEAYLQTIPEESLAYHAMKNHFSLWLMARGETRIAKAINPLKISDFKNLSELRELLIEIVRRRRSEQDRGKIIPFNEQAVTDESNIVSLASGSLGGKGRGIAFINTLIYNFGLTRFTPGINVRTPRTAIIGTDEFDRFIETNELQETLYHIQDYRELQKKFITGKLTGELEDKLRIILRLIRKPIAVRSSSLLEDSLTQPFSGIFGTYILPNNHPDLEIRLKQLLDAIKLVYASIYSPQARSYFEAIDYKIDEEKMGILIQEVVGNTFDRYYYPHLSGTAQSHNYYPVAHMKPEEGFAVAAVGLGQYVMTGETAFRFSPRYPKLDVLTPKQLFQNSQTEFFAVNLGQPEIDLLEGEEAGLKRLTISDAEKHGSLKHCVSIYNADNDRLDPGLDTPGPRIVDFGNILKYDYIPLARTINFLLELSKEAMGCPVEIEYAVDLEKDEKGLASFYLLQIKPLISMDYDFNLDMNTINKKKIVLYSTKSMGNGKLDNISDVVYVDEEIFDNTKTIQIANEIQELNRKMVQAGTPYILIGPGRWGTRDRFIGIPVNWPQISMAKVIVETGLKDYPLDASLGSHFFHNVTSMNVGYFSVQHYNHEEYIRWETLKKQTVVDKTTFCRHVRFNHPLTVFMDGKKRISVILEH
ncbi:MAG: pyruvate, phosphate dikinase [Chlorobi bacterium]|nr:pyruvate, phosphate dikinase [Chlorobiota bacterium]